MNLPNKLTVLRIFMIPVFIILMCLPSEALGVMSLVGSQISVVHFLAMIIFAVASFTDYLDGYLARKYKLVTNFGKFADPLADKMLVMTAFIMLVSFNLAPAWVVSIIVCRELAVTGLRLLLVKTATQMLAIIFLLTDDLFFKAIGIPIGQILLYSCLVFTIYSGLDYFVKNRHVFADSFTKTE